VSLFTDWQKQRVNEVWLKSRTETGQAFDAKPEFLWCEVSDEELAPYRRDFRGELYRNRWAYLGLGTSGCRTFRMGFYHRARVRNSNRNTFVPRETRCGSDSGSGTAPGSDWSTPVDFRKFAPFAADDLLMSPCYKQDSVTLHFTWKPDWASGQSAPAGD